MKEAKTTTTMVAPPLSGLHPWPKSIRRPLQPKPISSNNSTITKPHLPQLNQNHNTSNKENLEPFINNMRTTLFPKPKSEVKIIEIEPFEASLAEELSSIRKKMERLKVEKDKTENLLRERDLMLVMEMKELRIKGEAQKQLENQVDRLFRLKELRLSCIKNFPIRSFREREGEKIKQEEDEDKKLNIDDTKRDSITMRTRNTTMEGEGQDGH